MKLKYYLRGLGIGIIITTIILMIANSGYKKELTDEEIIARAERLGMVMKEDPLFSNSKLDKDSESMVDTETVQESETAANTEVAKETEMLENSEEAFETESETETESEIVVAGEVYHLVIPSGSMPRAICNELEENGVIESAESLRKYLGEVGYAKIIKVGEYEIPYGATNEEVYEILKAGPIKR
ncbi:MAG: hypothetical protein IKL07_00670 [Clostridium sp.]|nr:hypothetical protein [Clostridium sp.]